MLTGFEPVQQHRQQWHVARDDHVALLTEECTADDVRIVVRLQSTLGGEARKRIHQPEPRFGRLPCAQFPAMPYHGRLGTAFHGGTCDTLSLQKPHGRERPRMVDFPGESLGMMNEINELSH